MTMEQPKYIQSLKELPDFPGYYINLEGREVWSYVQHGSYQILRWQKIRVYERDGGIYFDIKKKGKKTVVSFTKAVWCLKNGVSYYAKPLEVYCFLTDGSMKERGQRIKEGWERRNNRIKNDRLKDLQQTIRVLGMLEEAYKLNYHPILNYVHDKKQEYINALASTRSYHLSRDRAELGYKMAYDRLLENIATGNGRIYNFDRWFLKTAWGLVHKVFDENSRYINIDKLKDIL